MRSKIRLWVMVTLVALTCCSAALAQVMAKVQGKCTDVEGKPIAGATVLFLNEENGQKITLKTDANGKYFTIGITLGSYTVTLIKDGVPLFHFNHYNAHSLDEADTVDFNMAKELSGVTANMSAEQKKKLEEAAKQREAARKEADVIKGLNEKLGQASTMEQAGQWEQAVAILSEAADIAPDKDLLWARLGEAQLGAGGAAGTDPAAATQHYLKAADAYKKAVEIKPNDGSYHNNLGQAYAKSGQPQEALAEYTTAAQADPLHAALYYFNLGAILTNEATKERDQAVKNKDLEQANKAFDQAVAAKPDYAEAWYQKGTNLVSMATFDKAGNVIPAPGTLEALNKYLELQPEGSHAADVKTLIAAFGGTVQTSFKKPKSK